MPECQPVLHITGTFDAVNTPDLQPAIDQLAAQPGAKVIVDVSALRLIDSWGVQAIVSLYRRLKVSGGKVRVVGLRAQPLAMLRLLRLDRVLTDGGPEGAA